MKQAPVKPIRLIEEQCQQVEATVFSLLEPQIDQMAQRFYLLDVSFEKESGVWYLRITLEGRETPVSLDDCEQVSRRVDPVLEHITLLQEMPYHLEVTSPGVFRPIRTQREFDFYRGRAIRLEACPPAGKSRKAPEPSAVLTGVLQEYDAETRVLTLLDAEGKSRTVCLSEGQQVCLNPALTLPGEGESLVDGRVTVFSPEKPSGTLCEFKEDSCP